MASVVRVSLMVLVTVLMAWTFRRQLATGVTWLPHGWLESRREEQPIRFWLVCSFWASIVAMLVYGTVKVAWLEATLPPRPLSEKEWFSLGIVALVIVVVAAVHFVPLWWRRGNPLVHWRELRRERQLREQIRDLLPRPTPRVFDASLEDFARYADIAWLEDILVHLTLQAEPRDFERAANETDVEDETEPSGSPP
jgi:hypothetical protein